MLISHKNKPPGMKKGLKSLLLNFNEINLYSIRRFWFNPKIDVTMTKKELVSSIAKKAGLSLKDANIALNAFVGSFGDAMKKGQRLQLPSMGTFKVEKRSARVVRNPRTGAKLNVPAKKVVKFKAAPALTKGLK
jgi:DNA-binding protein HU-beta